MKVLIAIDSMKGSLNSMEAGRAAAEGIRRAKPEAVITVKPLADGGEGTLQALTEGLGGRMETVQVCGPLGDLVQACYGILPDGKTAVMEMAQASGLSLVPEEKRDPRRATSFGTGQMIREAIRQGCRDFIIGIGGSATTDGGAGMLSALGYEFLDEEGRAVEPGIGALDRIVCIRSEQKPPELEQCRFRIACDVSNPLLGRAGSGLGLWPSERREGRGKVNFRSKDAPFRGENCGVHRTGRKGRAGRRGRRAAWDLPS